METQRSCGVGQTTAKQNLGQIAQRFADEFVSDTDKYKSSNPDRARILRVVVNGYCILPLSSLILLLGDTRTTRIQYDHFEEPSQNVLIS